MAGFGGIERPPHPPSAAPKASQAVLPIAYPTALPWTPERADVSVIYTTSELDLSAQEHVDQILSLAYCTILSLA